MKEAVFLKRLKRLRKEIHRILCNKLTYPKSAVGLMRTRSLPLERQLQIQTSLDEIIQIVDVKITELIDEMEERE